MDKIKGTELCPVCNVERDFEYKIGEKPYFKCECYKLIIMCSLCKCRKCLDCNIGSNFELDLSEEEYDALVIQKDREGEYHSLDIINELLEKNGFKRI